MKHSGAHTPRRWTDATVASERPAVMPADPALVMEARFEKAFVMARRPCVSWFNLARMTGKTAPYLKAKYGDEGGR